MDILEDLTTGIMTMALRGRLDATSAPRLQTRVLELIDSGVHRFVMDLSRLEFINSVGLRVFLTAAKRLSPLGGRIVLCAAPSPVRQAVEVAGFDRLFTIVESREDAARAIGGSA